MTLNELIKSCCKQDRKAQSELFSRYKDALFLICLKYARNEAEAEDNLHDAFVTIFQKIKTYKGKGSFEGWMKRITIYKAIDAYKANKYIPTEIKDDLLEDTTATTDLLEIPLDMLLACIQELPDQYRLVFNLYQLDGYSHKEVAAMLDISENTSKSNYHRAKQILREKITAITKTMNLKELQNER